MGVALLAPAVLLAAVFLAAPRGTLAASATTTTTTTDYTIYSGQPAGMGDDGDGRAVEVGVRFRASVAGAVVGVRFWKYAPNAGRHRGSLWSASGRRLATGVFASERSSGWATLRFAKPVSIGAGATYVASYHTNTGHYASAPRVFSHGATVGNDVLQASAGVYRYGRSGFPASRWQGSSYFVDVLFRPARRTHPGPSGGSGSTSSRPQSPSPSATSATGTTPSPSATSATGTPPSPSATSATGTTPSPSATSTPPSSSSSAPRPSTGFPDASNTGTTGPLTVWAGDYHTSSNGQNVTGLDIRGTLYIDNSNVTASNFKATGAGGSSWAVVVGQKATAAAPLTGVAISDCTLDGGRSDQGGITDPVGHSTWTMKRCDISNGENGIRAAGHATISDCWVHNLASSSSAPHYDAVEVYSGSMSVFDHDTLSLNFDETSVLNVQGDFGPVSGTVLKNSLVNGGGWTLNIRSLAASVTGTVLTNNRFGDTHGYGYAAIDDGTTSQISGNVRDATGVNIDSQL